MTDFLKYCKEKKIYIALILMFLYVLPLVVYNIPYIDDLGRQYYGHGWDNDGRVMATLLMKIIGLNNFIADFSPIPLFIGLIFICISGYYFCYKYKIYSIVSIIIISLCLLISPFFLENISYKFDALGMCTSVALAVFAGVYCIQNKINFLTGLILFISLFLLLSFYQAAINLFVILALFGVYYLLGKFSIKQVLLKFIIIVLITFIALIFYKWFSHFFVLGGYSLSHSESVPFNISSLSIIKNNFKIFMERIFDVYFYRVYGCFCLCVFSLYLLLLFKKTNFSQKIYTPFFLILSVFFICGVLVILKSPVFAPRVYIGLIGIYFIMGYVLVTKLPPKLLFLPVLFVFIHFVQAYTYYNALNKQYQQEKFLYNLMTTDIEQYKEKIDRIKIIGVEPQKSRSSVSFKAIDFLVPRYINNGWVHGLAFFRDNSINLGFNNNNIDNAFLTNCNNVIFYHQMYNVYVYKETVVFDYNKTCKLENKIIANQIQSGNKIELNQELKGNLVLDALIYSFNPQTELRSLTFEFNHSLFEQAIKDENIFYVHIFKEGSDQFYNADRPLNQLVKINDRYYLNTSTGDIDFKDITKINFGFYNSSAKTNSARFSVNLQMLKVKEHIK